jgi:hypothetical protein
VPILRCVDGYFIGAGDPAETKLAIFRELVDRLRLLEIPYLDGDSGILPCGLLRGESRVLLLRSDGDPGLEGVLRLSSLFSRATGIWDGDTPVSALRVLLVMMDAFGDSSIDCSATGDMNVWRIVVAGGVESDALD